MSGYAFDYFKALYAINRSFAEAIFCRRLGGSVLLIGKAGVLFFL